MSESSLRGHDAEADARRRWFREAVLPLEPALRAFVRRAGRGRVDAAAVSREALIRVLASARGPQRTSPPAVTLRAAARLAVASALGRERVVSVDFGREREADPFEAALAAPPSPDHQSRRLAFTVSALPHGRRRAMALRKGREMGLPALADRLGVAPAEAERLLAESLCDCADAMAEGLPRPPPVLGRRLGSDLEAARLLIRRFEPGAPASAAAECERWLLGGDERLAAYERLRRAWDAADALHVGRGGQAVSVAAPGRRFGLVAAAAGVAVAVLVSGAAVVAEAGRAYTTGPGERRLVAISRGIKAGLGPSARLRVSGIAGDRLELVRGEAAFAVDPAAGRRLLVHVLDRQVTATGGVFAIEARPPVMEVTVTEGAADVASRRGDALTGRRLAAGQAAAFGRLRAEARVAEDDQLRRAAMLAEGPPPKR